MKYLSPKHVFSLRRFNEFIVETDRNKGMRILKNTLFFYIILVLLPGYSQVDPKPVIIEGKVVTASTGEPVDDAHVFVIDGEEETLTGPNGEFRIKSWQKTPLKLTVEKTDRYHKISIVITDPSRKQLIRLKNKP